MLKLQVKKAIKNSFKNGHLNTLSEASVLLVLFIISSSRYKKRKNWADRSDKGRKLAWCISLTKQMQSIETCLLFWENTVFVLTGVIKRS